MMIESKSPSTFWDNKTKMLHLGLALLVTLQMFNSLVMQTPESGAMSGFGGVVFEIHEWMGMAALGIVLVHWCWSMWGSGGESIRHLFPWRSADRARIWRELRELASLRLPQGGPQGRLSGLVHGLGFLAVTAMALSGALLFVGMPESGGELTPLTEGAEEIHEIMATFVWVYWGGHVALAVLHELLARDGSLRRMFGLTAI